MVFVKQTYARMVHVYWHGMVYAHGIRYKQCCNFTFEFWVYYSCYRISVGVLVFSFFNFCLLAAKEENVVVIVIGVLHGRVVGGRNEWHVFVGLMGGFILGFGDMQR